MAQKSKGTFGAQKSRAAQGRLRIRKHAVLPAPFWLKYNRKNLPIRQYGEIFSADFISKIHWQNCFASEKSKFCAGPRRGGAGMLPHGKAAQRRSPCKSAFCGACFLVWSRPKQSRFLGGMTGFKGLFNPLPHPEVPALPAKSQRRRKQNAQNRPAASAKGPQQAFHGHAGMKSDQSTPVDPQAGRMVGIPENMNLHHASTNWRRLLVEKMVEQG